MATAAIDLSYSELSNRTHILIELTKSLGAAIQDNIPDLVPVLFAKDAADYTTYQTPSVVLFDPTPIFRPELQTNHPVYKDYDYEKLTAKEFLEPIPLKFLYEIHVATRNPDNDLVLLEKMLKLKRKVKEIYVEIGEKGQEIYDVVPLYWHEPTEMDSSDNSKIRIFTVSARLFLEVFDFKQVRLLRPNNPVVFTEGDYKLSTYWLKSTLAHTVAPDDTEIFITEDTKDYPLTGAILFNNGEIFTYINKTLKSFKSIEKVQDYHLYGEEIVYATTS